MVEPIRSGEVFPHAELKQGEPPRHTEVGHEKCAYYTNAHYKASCGHGFMIYGGALYSEDYVRELKTQAQLLLAGLSRNNMFWGDPSVPDPLARLTELVSD